MNRSYPWMIAVLASVVLIISNGMSISGLSVFDESLISKFGWSRGELKFRDMITFGTSALLAPFGGIIIDKLGVKRCMLAGWVMLAVAYFLYSGVESLANLYVAHALLGVVLVFCGLNPAIILVSSWFQKKRGVAIGITLVGTSLGGMIFPQYGTYMSELVGWRMAMTYAMIFPAFMFAMVALFVRNGPEAEASAKPQDVALSQGLGYVEALKTKAFWAISVVAMTTFYTVLAVQAHLFLYLRDLDFTPASATNAISLFFLCAVIGKFVFGLLSDYLNYKLVFIGNIIVMLTGSACLAMMNSSLIWIAIILFGLGWGGVYTTIQLSAVNCFGLVSAGKILGTIAVLDCLGGGLGIWLTGVFYSMYGDYQVAFMIFVVLIITALIFVTQIATPAKQNHDMLAGAAK
ncbi:MFS transporter [Alteromonas sp. NFXS44]|uniref:MFS transporter n=1 Tax=Alteromonas sp. NFXS44 TaxID=2818435 RepID=UPI0032DE421E